MRGKPPLWQCSYCDTRTAQREAFLTGKQVNIIKVPWGFRVMIEGRHRVSVYGDRFPKKCTCGLNVGACLSFGEASLLLSLGVLDEI